MFNSFSEVVVIMLAPQPLIVNNYVFCKYNTGMKDWYYRCEKKV